MKTLGRILMILLAGIGGAVLVVGVVLWQKEDAHRDEVQGQLASVPQASRPPASPDHYYSYVDGTEYGYQPALSEEDRQTGKIGAELVMFRYHGIRNGRIQLGTNLGGGISQVVDCTEPCDTVRIRLFSGWREIKRDYLALTPGMIVGMAMSDARRGKMKLHLNRDGKYVFFGETRAEATLFGSAKEVGGI
jgi:hypothetical protein